jgi:hypothetical protein
MAEPPRPTRCRELPAKGLAKPSAACAMAIRPSVLTPAPSSGGRLLPNDDAISSRGLRASVEAAVTVHDSAQCWEYNSAQFWGGIRAIGL